MDHNHAKETPLRTHEPKQLENMITMHQAVADALLVALLFLTLVLRESFTLLILSPVTKKNYFPEYMHLLLALLPWAYFRKHPSAHLGF
jgi:hypothetical protein